MLNRRKFLTKLLSFCSIAPLVALFPSLAKSEIEYQDVKCTGSWRFKGEEYLSFLRTGNHARKSLKQR